MIEPLDALKDRLVAAVGGGVSVEGTSLLIERGRLLAVAAMLRDDPALQCDFLSNLCAVDFVKENYLEVVSHLFSTTLRHGPLTIRVRTGDRAHDAKMPSLVSLWRSAEYQEREAFDLYGVVFEGHPDLRRILMWDEFVDFPTFVGITVPKRSIEITHT